MQKGHVGVAYARRVAGTREVEIRGSGDGRAGCAEGSGAQGRAVLAERQNLQNLELSRAHYTPLALTRDEHPCE